MITKTEYPQMYLDGKVILHEVCNIIHSKTCSEVMFITDEKHPAEYWQKLTENYADPQGGSYCIQIKEDGKIVYESDGCYALFVEVINTVESFQTIRIVFDQYLESIYSPPPRSSSFIIGIQSIVERTVRRVLKENQKK